MRRCFVYSLFLLFCATAAGFGQEKKNLESMPGGRNQFIQGQNLNQPVQHEQPSDREKDNPNCREWKNGACTVCSSDSAVVLPLKNMTKTPILLCRNMKPGPAKLEMSTHAEPGISGAWELEFGLGYQTSARDECPHQFIASNFPPLRNAYEIGPISIEGEIPADGTIQSLACVGLSSARVGREAKETGASLRAFHLRVVSE